MASPEKLRVEVVYARSDAQHIATLELSDGATVREAVRQSGLLEKFPEIDAAVCELGIFGRPVAPDQVLHDGDRVEIYRSLARDPKEARRERARSKR